MVTISTPTRSGSIRSAAASAATTTATVPSIHAVFSTDGSRYQSWQAELLAYSHRRVGQPGPLTRLWSAWAAPTTFLGSTVQTEPYSPHPVTGDDYDPYNKPAALQAWLQETCPLGDTVLLLDPDCVFVAPVTLTAEPGRPVAQPVGYMNPTDNAELVRRHCRRPALVQALGIPTLIHRDDLAVLAPLWLAKTEAIRNDEIARELAGWTAEMWGYACAAAELGLQHQLRELAAFSTEDRDDLPLVHYCWESVGASGRWRWYKRGYRPWEPVADPPDDLPRASAALLGLLNEWAARQQYRVAGSGGRPRPSDASRASKR